MNKTCENCKHSAEGKAECDLNKASPIVASCIGFEPKDHNYTKPPLGAAPAFIPAERRIKELADAISRAAEEGRNYPGHISLWAREILAQCAIINSAKDWEKDPPCFIS